MKLQRREGSLVADIPPGARRVVGMGLLGFGAVWTSFIAFWTASAIGMGAPLFFPLFSIPFWIVGFSMLGKAASMIFGRTRLQLTGADMKVVRAVLGLERETAGSATDISRVRIARKERLWHGSNRERRRLPPRSIAIDEGVKTHWLGEGLSQVELEWLAAEIADHLGTEVVDEG